MNNNKKKKEMMRARMGWAILALMAAGCSENGNTGAPETQVDAKAIRIGQTVQGITKAAVTDGSDVTATVLMCDGETADWAGFRPVYKNGIAEGELQSRANVATISFMAGTNAEVKLNQTLYYTHDGSGEKSKVKSHLAAVAPDGNPEGTMVSMEMTDGQQDVMYAAAKDAGSESSPVTANLVFEHLTTQLNFEVKLTMTEGGEWDDKPVLIKAISIQNVRLPQAVNATNGTVTWTGNVLLNVPGIPFANLSTTAAKAGSPVMIKAGGTVKVDVILTVGGDNYPFTNITIKDGEGGDLITEEAKAHLITLNVKEPEKAGDAGSITATATVEPWKSGANGFADVD